jgi:hypothetical protein
LKDLMRGTRKGNKQKEVKRSYSCCSVQFRRGLVWFRVLRRSAEEVHQAGGRSRRNRRSRRRRSYHGQESFACRV